MPAPRMRVWPFLLGCAAFFFAAAPAEGQQASTPEGVPSVKLEPPVPLPAELVGRPVIRVEVVTAGGRWQVAEKLRESRLGTPLGAAYVRSVMRELLATGRYADVRAEVLPAGAGAI